MRADVWAPFATTLACRTGDIAVEMVRDDGGWWRGPELTDGQEYSFVVDGEGPFPDPRSPRQPHGVHGPSQAFDASQFAWTDANWPGRDARGAVFYELHVGTFTPQGTLDAAAAELPSLAEIGIEFIELMPIAPIPGSRGWGYDGVSLFAVYEQYGGPAALQRFVDSAHAAGLAVALDVVYNHLGPDGNYLGVFGPYFTGAHHTPWGAAVNLDQEGSPEVRRYFLDAALRWFSDFHVDGLRLDAVHELHDDSPLHWLAQLSNETANLARHLGRPLSLIAETNLNDVSILAPVSDGGLGQTAQWADDVHHALHSYLTGENTGLYADFASLYALDKAYRSVFVHDGTYSSFHQREWGAPVPQSVDRVRLVVCASNHDQVGNRAEGDRPSATLSPGAQAASLALVLLSPFTPMLFQGEEYGETRPFLFFSDHDEPLGAAVTEGRITEFAGHGWDAEATVPDPQAESTFAASILDRTASGPSYQAIREWFAKVMAARPRTLVPGAWERNPVSITERSSRQLTMTGPVRIHANLSAEPVAYEGRPVAVFGDVAVTGEGFTLTPDAVALVLSEACMSGWSKVPAEALRVGPDWSITSLDPGSRPGWDGDRDDAERHMRRQADHLSLMQEKLFAHGRSGGTRSVLLVLQGMDTSGKGGIVRHVIGMVDPQGVAHRSFGVPTEEERSHHYLWRIKNALPPAGKIGVFDRSHYEDVLVVRVHDLVPGDPWEERYAEINAFEADVVSAGTPIVKCALMISPQEQFARLRERLERPDKYWKFNPADIDERMHWDEYQEAYQAALRATSTEVAPWYAIPADTKWFSRLAIAELLLGALESLDLGWPPADFNVAEQMQRLDELGETPGPAA